MKARWRMCGAAATVLLLSSSAWAQDGLRSASLPERNLRSPDPSAPVDQFRVGPRFYSPFSDPRVRDRQRPPKFPRGLGFFPYDSYVTPYGLGTLPPEEQPFGYLQLQVVPAAAEVLVDGYYVGSVDDVRRMGVGRALEPGPHRVELRAAGYESVTFDVRIAPEETVVYRRDLAAITPALPPPVPGVPKTFYVIPGCYAGDRPPAAVRLPATCDAANARTIPPQVSAVKVAGR